MVVAGVAIAIVVIARLVSTTVEALKCSGSCFYTNIQNTSAFVVVVVAAIATTAKTTTNAEVFWMFV